MADNTTTINQNTTTTQTVNYNPQQQALANLQLMWSNEYMNFWRDNYKPMEEEALRLNRDLMPLQADVQKWQLKGQQELTPLQTELTKAELAAQKGLLPLGTSLAEARMQGELETTPLQTELNKESIAAARGLLPYQTNLAKTQMENDIQDALSVRSVNDQYYKQALKGVNIGQKVNEARADVASAFKESDAANVRSAARLGLDPTSGRFASRFQASGLDKARGLAGAMTTARDSAEDQNFNRLQSAVNTYKSGSRGIVSI